MSADFIVGVMKARIGAVLSRCPRWIGLRTLAIEVGIGSVDMEVLYARAVRELIWDGLLLFSMNEDSAPGYMVLYPSLLLPSPRELASLPIVPEPGVPVHCMGSSLSRAGGGGWMWICAVGVN